MNDNAVQPLVPVGLKATVAGIFRGIGTSLIKVPVMPLTPAIETPLQRTHTVTVSWGLKFGPGAIDAVTLVVTVPVHGTPPERVMVTGGGEGHPPMERRAQQKIRNIVL
jgi:hypothetical protein